MGIRDLTLKYETKLPNGKKQPLHRVWELDVLGDVLRLERYGSFCGWAKLKLKKEGMEVYRITKPWGGKKRTEYFFKQRTRGYTGNQFSFVEYLDLTANYKRVPTPEQCVQAGLNAKIEKKYKIVKGYRCNLEKILDTQVPSSD